MPRIVHFEIHALDPERLAEFYRSLFGWKISKWDGPMEYWLIETGPKDEPGINGGLMRRQGGSPTDGQAVNAFVCTADVESLDDVLARLEGLGGRIALPRMAVPGIGWLAYVKDPDGNIMGAMQSDPAAA
jgi:predicted enzyme related to lactoylglutathione lyase